MAIPAPPVHAPPQEIGVGLANSIALLVLGLTVGVAADVAFQSTLATAALADHVRDAAARNALDDGLHRLQLLAAIGYVITLLASVLVLWRLPGYLQPAHGGVRYDLIAGALAVTIFVIAMLLILGALRTDLPMPPVRG